MSSDQQMRNRLVQFSKELGPQAGCFWFSTGVPLSSAKRLDNTEFGRRIRKHDAADNLTASQLAGLAHEIDVMGWVNLGAIPPADGKNRLKWSTWSVRSLCQWAAAGCPDKKGESDLGMIQMFGVVAPREY